MITYRTIIIYYTSWFKRVIYRVLSRCVTQLRYLFIDMVVYGFEFTGWRTVCFVFFFVIILAPRTYENVK